MFFFESIILQPAAFPLFIMTPNLGIFNIENILIHEKNNLEGSKVNKRSEVSQCK